MVDGAPQKLPPQLLLAGSNQLEQRGQHPIERD